MLKKGANGGYDSATLECCAALAAKILGKNVLTTAALADDALFPDLSRPTAEIEDPVLLARAYRIDHIGISAYLVALAAWQRGLRVTFHYEVASKSARFANSIAYPSRGEFFSVSDGKRTHFFLRTLGDLTSREISALCDDKQATKERLIPAGVPVPDGILVDKAALDEAALSAFMQRHPGKRFHVKPLAGSLAIGAVGEIAANKVKLSIQEHAYEKLLVEEHIYGYPLRVNVVGGRYVGAYRAMKPEVVGDGSASVSDLINRKLSTRRHKSLYPKAVLLINEREKACLADQGMTLESVPELGQRVAINHALQSDQGADLVDVSETASVDARELAVRACQAVGVPSAGVDLLVDDESGKHVVLEVNQCPMLKGNVFPFYTRSPGNRVAEAIIDHYFPESLNNRRFTKASFDFMRVCETLKSGTAAEVTLPVLGRDWVHKRIRLAGAVLAQDAQDAIHSFAERQGVYIDILQLDGKDVLIDALGPSARFEAFLTRLKAAMTKTSS